MAAGDTQNAERRGFLSLLWGVIRRPRKTFEDLREHKGRGWLDLALLYLLLAVAVIAVSAPISARQAQEAFRAQLANRGPGLEELPPEAQERATQLATDPLFTMLIPGLLSIAGAWLSWLVWAGALHLMGTMLGGNNSFGQMFRAVVWSWLPQTLRSLLQAVYVLLTSETIGNPGLSGLVTRPAAAPGEIVPAPGAGELALQSFLSQIDLFQIWNFILLVIVVVATARLSRRKAFLITLIVWVLITLVRMLPALASGMVAGSLAGID